MLTEEGNFPFNEQYVANCPEKVINYIVDLIDYTFALKNGVKRLDLLKKRSRKEIKRDTPLSIQVEFSM